MAEYLGNRMFRYPAEDRDPRHVVGKPHDDRARQFVPFMALKGYHELVRQAEQTPEPRRPLTEEKAAALSVALAQAERGQLVRVTHYAHDHYQITCDRVRQVDPTLRMLHLQESRLPFDAIDRIQLGPVAES